VTLQINSLLTRLLDWLNRRISRPDRFNFGVRTARTYCIGNLMAPIFDVYIAGKWDVFFFCR